MGQIMAIPIIKIPEIFLIKKFKYFYFVFTDDSSHKADHWTWYQTSNIQ